MSKCLAFSGIVLAAAMFGAMPAAGQDAEHGKAVFARCGICHSGKAGSGPVVGPALGGLIGRKAGTLAGFQYSKSLAQSDIVWNAETLDRYIEAPQKVVPGNKMAFFGLKDPTDRQDLIAYLETLKD